jgi:hypothetical protein
MSKVSKLALSCLFLAAGGLLFSSCGSDQAEQTETVPEPEVVLEDDGFPDDMPEENAFIIPSAFHLSSLFQKAGLGFADGITNNPDKVGEYDSRMNKLLNFGVYSADLFYCVLNDQNQLSRKYINAMKQLSEETGMGSIFNIKEILERFEANVDNQDSVLKYVLQIQEQTDNYIEQSNEEHTAMVIFAGAWLEGMYVSLESYGTGQNEELGKRIVEQTYMLDNIIKGLELHPGDPEELNELSKQLVALHDKVSASDNYPKDEYEFHEHKLSHEDILAFKDNLSPIRNSLTKNTSN